MLSGHDLRAWREEYAAGAAPAALPYEVDAFARAGLDLVVRSNVESRSSTDYARKVEHRTRYSVALPLQAASRPPGAATS